MEKEAKDLLLLHQFLVGLPDKLKDSFIVSVAASWDIYNRIAHIATRGLDGMLVGSCKKLSGSGKQIKGALGQGSRRPLQETQPLIQGM